MILKNGQRTTTPLLDRIPFFDERSRAYPVRTVGQRATRSYTWALGQDVLDQGNQGSCVGHAFSHELEARPSVVADVDPRGIYFEAQKIDEWEGGAYDGASPFYEGTSILAGAKTVKAMGHYREYRWAFSVDDLAYAVGHEGPGVLGVTWTTDMFRPDENGYIWPTGLFAGGHAILANGVNLKRREFLLPNSWGPEWSTIQWGAQTLHGYCKVTFEAMAAMLEDNGEACVPIRPRA